MTEIAEDTRKEYENRLAARRAELTGEQQLSRRIWLWRRILFALIAITIVLAFERILAPGWIALEIIVFVVLMAVHQRVNRRRERLERAVRYYERGIARIDDKWMGDGAGERFADHSHLYAEDLDLFGKGSLFELLSSVRTRAAEEMLAGWLKAPALLNEIIERQKAVSELKMMPDLREDLALLGPDVDAGIHHEELSEWGVSPAVLTNPVMPLLAAVIGIYSAISVVLWIADGRRTMAMAGLLLILSFLFIYRRQVSRIIAEVERPSRDLFLLAEILARIEREKFNSPKLVNLRAALEADGHPPSRQIARLARLVQILDSVKNQFFAPIAFLLMIPAQLAYAIDRWRQGSGPKISIWLDAIAEIEALSSLAGYAYEHPSDPFPELIETGPCFEGEGLGHPLIPQSRCIRNDIRLDDDQRLLVVSGSNMSGKSTLLRTVGINLVLALAGAPVRAKRLRVSPMAIGASIHILDSLQEGASRFYAEITRLRQIVDLTRGKLPTLFLLDEILSGTNSHDRRIGAEAVVKGLVERAAIGLITTHDLSLTKIVDSLDGRAANIHFEDRMEEGRMVFDYLIRPGVVERSNALELMRTIGLDV